MFHELEDFVKMLNSTRDFLQLALNEIPDDHFDWSPTASTSSTETILKHIRLWETTYISRIFYGDDRAIDHNISKLSGKKTVLNKLAEIRKHSLDTLHRLQPEDMEREFDHNGNPFNVRRMLIN